jgi:hypothetical protein
MDPGVAFVLEGWIREPGEAERRPAGHCQPSEPFVSSSKPDSPFASDVEVAELVRLFESCELPGDRWTHRAHLAVAATYLRRYPLNEATDRARTHIRRYNESRGNHTGYHETITVLFMRLVACQLQSDPPALFEFVNALAARFPMDWLQGYYSKNRLWSDEARAAFVGPDVRPLDF